MKILAVVLCCVIGLLAQTRGETDAQVSTVSVYVHSGSINPTLRLPCAEQIASALFETAGVQIDWRPAEPKDDPQNGTVVIEMVSGVAQTSHPGALAYALPFEGEHIRIFWDRVQQITDDSTVTTVLAYVMVHEITHMLQGTNHHAREGIMSAHWTCKDLQRLKHEHLSFERQDIELIHRGLERRPDRQFETMKDWTQNKEFE